MADYYRQLKREKVLQEEPARPTVGGSFLGSRECQGCHPDTFDLWESGPHAQALHTLKERGKEGAPECVSCHTLGFGYTGGFIDTETTPELGGVHCENCHGVGSNHGANPSSEYGNASEATCRSCHTEERSSGFDFDTYWEQIVH